MDGNFVNEDDSTASNPLADEEEPTTHDDDNDDDDDTSQAPVSSVPEVIDPSKDTSQHTPAEAASTPIEEHH